MEDAAKMVRIGKVEEGKEEVEERIARECPVPKPSGFFGQLLGFKEDRGERPIVRIETVESKDRGRSGDVG